MIIPRIQKEKYYDGNIGLEKSIKFLAKGDFGKKAVDALKLYLPQFDFEEDENAILCFEKADYEAEKYSITINDKIVLKYGDYMGARNAAATLAQLVTKKDGKYFVPECELEDFPKFKVRSFLMDLARGIGFKDEIEETLIRLSLMKYNRVHLHLTDSEGVAWQSKKHPALAGPKGDQYSMAYFKSLNNLCNILGLEVVPEIDLPGHAKTIIEAYPDLLCPVEIPDELKNEDMPWAVCAGKEDVYSLFKDLTEEIIEMFPDSEYIHIGCDEVEMRDINRVTFWGDCPKCQALGYEGKQEIFYHFVQRMYDIVTGLGKKVIMWSDWVDISKPSPLPKDIVMEFWKIASAPRGPHDGCSMEKFLEQGYTVINAHYPETYVDLAQYATEEKLNTWLPTRRPETDEKYHNMIVGGETCAWEYGNKPEYDFYRYTLASPLGLFADRVWNASDREYDIEYQIALTRAILGADCPENFNIFEYLGAIMLPPQKNLLGIVENIKATDAELEQIQLKLIPISVSGGYGSLQAQTYIECLEWVKNNR